jgi:hypothetical protein
MSGPEGLMREDLVTLADREVMRETESALVCRVKGRMLSVPRSHVGIGDDAIRRVGARRALVNPRWLARQLEVDGPAPAG